MLKTGMLLYRPVNHVHKLTGAGFNSLVLMVALATWQRRLYSLLFFNPARCIVLSALGDSKWRDQAFWRGFHRACWDGSMNSRADLYESIAYDYSIFYVHYLYSYFI